jgi:hypothetical protein
MTSRTAVVAWACVSLSVAAPAQQPPPVRPLGPIVRVSAEPLASVAAVRALPDGRVFVNDITAHRVLLFDSTLTTATVVADSTSATAKAYGARAGTLIAFRGDSTLFVDPTSLSMLVLDASGRIVRVISVPRPADVAYLVGAILGTPGFDAKGRLVYRGPSGTTGPPLRGPCVKPAIVDSVPIVRVDLATRKVDTAALYGIPVARWAVNCDANGNAAGRRRLIDPYRLTDAWAILPDGAIGVVRGRDYHVDWVNADGTRSSSPKMGFDWKHISDEDKVATIDSLRAVFQLRADSMNAALQARAANGRGAVPPTVAMVTTSDFVPANELPDYLPPFGDGAVSADADGHIWIYTSTRVNGQPVYDIVDRHGALIDRVQLPPFRSIAGFGPGVVYMGVLDGAKVAHVERARVK